MRIVQLSVCFFILLSISTLKCWGIEYTVKTIPNPKEYDVTTYVSNPDKILSEETVGKINILLDSLEKATQAEVAVVAVNSIGYDNIELFASRLFEHWGIGKAGLDNGLLILLVLDQRKIKFEVGYGLEDVLPDAVCKRIQMKYAVPEFKEGNYNKGVLDCVIAVNPLIRKEPLPEKPKYLSNLRDWGIVSIIAVILLFLTWRKMSTIESKLVSLSPVIVAKRAGRKANKLLVPSFFILGFCGFLFFNERLFFKFAYTDDLLWTGLAYPLSVIPSFMYKVYRKRRVILRPRCEKCSSHMRLVGDAEKNKYLSPAKQVEQKIKSVRHDFFLCDSCHNLRGYSTPLNGAIKQCPQCENYTYYMRNREVIRKSTYVNKGQVRQNYACCYCNFTQSFLLETPMLRYTETTYTSSSSSGSSSGSSSSSSSSRSSGSFGGGRSGGGGSTSSW